MHFTAHARRHDQPAVWESGRIRARARSRRNRADRSGSLPRRGVAPGLDPPHWPVPGGWVVSRRTAARVTRGAICLRNSTHFARDRIQMGEPGDVATWPGQARDEARADRVDAPANTIGMVWVSCISGATIPLPDARMTSGARATNSAASLRMSSASFPAQRKSIRALRPLVQPSAWSPAGMPRGRATSRSSSHQWT